MTRIVVGGLLCLCACGSSSPDNFIEASTKLSCKYMKKCDDAAWSEAGFSSVSDCTDKILDAPLSSGEDEEGLGDVFGLTAREAFVLACPDFDKGNARKCLAGMRKAKRKCDLEAGSDEQEKACAEVCGTPEASELFVNPNDLELALTLAEEVAEE